MNPSPLVIPRLVKRIAQCLSAKSAVALGVILFGSSAANAANGTWTNDASSVWSTTANWLNGIVADGTDSTADFSTINISANRTNILDTSRTIGNLSFGDTNGTQFWLLNSSGGSVLTLATSSGTPTITTATNGANAFVAAINAPLAGSGGLIKAGNGILALGGTNTYSGATTVNGGVLMITNGPISVAGSAALQNANAGGLVAYYSFNNVAGGRIINEGSGGAIMDGFMVGNGGVSIGVGQGRFGDNCLNVSQGAANGGTTAGQSTAMMGNGGYMLVNNPVVPFTCTLNNSAANWTWAMWIKTTTQGAGYMYQGSASWASGNTAFYLTTGASVVGGGVRAAGVRNSQGWEEGTTVINDGNWHHLSMTCSNGIKVLYVDGAVDPWLVDGWGGNGVGNQLWIGGTGGTINDGNTQMVGLIDKVTVYNRPLSLAEIKSLTNNVVPGVAAPAIPLTSPVTVASGAKLDVNGYSATVTNLTLSGTVDSAINGGYLGTWFNVDTTANGLITNMPAVGTLNFYKLGPNKLTIAGLMANNNTVVRQGTLTMSGSGLITTNGANNTITVADGTQRAILDIPSGTTVVARNLVLGGISASANGGGAAGAVYNRGTFLNYGNTGTGAFAIGNATGGAGDTNNGYGYFLNDSAVTLALGESGVGGLGGGDGVFEVKSGTANFTNWITLGRCQGTVAGQQQRSLMLIRGGTVNGPNFNNEDRWNWSGSTINFYTVMDVGAGGALGSLGTLHNILMGGDNNANATSILTIDNGGFVQVNNINASQVNPVCTVNFNNAVVAPTVATTTFLGANLDNVFVYSGGVTFSNNLDIGSVVQLKAPTGSSITSIPVTGNGSGYIGRPIVQIVDGSGVGATAIAEWNQSLGTVTSITITAPGSGYSSPTVTLVGGGSTTPATLGTPVLGAATSGGLTKIGTGTLTLSGGYTYSGSTVVQAGGLSVPTSLVAPSPAGNLSVSNANLTLDLSSGTSLPVNNLTFQNNTTNNFNYGTVSVNPANPAINAGGTISVPGSGIVINITAFGLQPGTFQLIKYTGTALSGPQFANISIGSLPPGVVASLVNNTGNDSVDLTITSTGQNLSWYGLDGVTGLINPIWAINTPTNWVSVGTTTPALRYQEYTSGGVTVGDPVTFDDTLYNDFSNPQATNLNLTAAVRPFQLIVNATLPYSISGAGSIVGQGSIVKSNTGSLNLNTSNNFSGGVFITGGSVIITNDTALGTNNGTVTLNTGTLQVNGSTTNNTRVITVPATSSIAVATNIVARFGGSVSGAGGLTKVDNGTLVLAGTNSLVGALTVNQGMLTTLGTNVLAAVPVIGNSAGFNGVLNVAGGIFQDNNNPANVFNSSLTIGNVAGAAGDMIVSAGIVTIPKQLTIGPTTYGAFNQSGGTTTIGGFMALGGNASGGVLNQSGGTINMTNTSATIGYAATTTFGVMNLSGTAVFNVSGAGNGVWPGEVGNGVLNISANAALTVTNDGIVLGRGNAAGNGTVNLNGGVATVNFVTNGPGIGTFNFNGGTLKANAAGTFTKGTVNTTFFDYNGGAVIDDGGLAITFTQPIKAPTGFGVTSIAVTPNTSSGYIDSPIVAISGGNGSNALATATVSGGQVTALTVTCPGSGYLNSDVLTVTFTGGGANPVAPTVGAVTFAANGTGGLTKKGSGTATLTGANTFGGAIVVSGGTLALTTASTYSNNVSVNAGSLSLMTASTILGTTTVTNGAVFSVSQVTTNTGSISNLTLGVTSGSGATLSLALASGNTASPFLTCGTLTLNASNNVALAGRFTVGTFPIIKYFGAIAGVGSLTNVTLPQGVVGYVSNNVPTSTIYAVITSTGPGLVWTGFNTSPALTNLWDINSTTNWTLSGTPTTYQESVPPGDAVTFNDTGSGTVNISNTISPFSMVISNTSKAYTYRGTGHISGNGGIVKYGTNAVFMNLTNSTYTGDTIISNGFVQIGSASAISAAGNLFVGAGATLELNGFSQTTPQFTGAGIVDNNSANNVTLTFGSGGGGTWSGTIQDQGLGGGVALTKVGNNTLILRGTNSLNTTANPAAQFNAGTTIVTNGAVVNMANTEYWIAANGAVTATNIIDGGTVIANNFVVIGRNNAAANGTLIVNSGTLQKSGGNVIVIGSLGSTGSLIVNGGQVLNNSEIWLGENATANASLYLNGGLLQATDIRPNGAGPASYNAYFNGGILQATASSANFLQVFCNVMSNGLILDDNGFNLSIGGAALASGDAFNGGLFKKGSGTVYLDAANTYGGTTVVTNGTLAGVGSISGPMLVTPAGSLGAGDAAAVGTFTINNNLTLQGKAALRVNKTGGTPVQDNVTVAGNINYTGSTLVIANITSDATPLTTSDTFQLFSVSGSVTGSPTVTGSPGSGLAYSFNPASGLLSIVTSSIASYPTNITATVSGSTLSLSWPTTHLGWILQTQTNTISTGLNTNWFDWPGSTSVTQTNIGINPANPTVFFRLKHP